jgi:acyl-CoA synthetase (AMP-forming)/AMP-acid ligase II
VHVLREDRLDGARLERELASAQASGEPMALLGTSFAFVHAEDALGATRYRLPPGSRILQTGGFKGRSRTVEPVELLELLRARYGVPETHVVQEYGMTELCSQLYETTLREAVLGQAIGPRRLWAPGWLRVRIVDPETLADVPEGAEGLIRIDDPCNLDTACAIQTSDRGVRVSDGIVVLGRAAGATARGCSLAIDAALGTR